MVKRDASDLMLLDQAFRKVRVRFSVRVTDGSGRVERRKNEGV